jgi:hypothetical protein
MATQGYYIFYSKLCVSRVQTPRLIGIVVLQRWIYVIVKSVFTILFLHLSSMHSIHVPIPLPSDKMFAPYTTELSIFTFDISNFLCIDPRVYQ